MAVILRVMGVLMMLFSLTLVPPVIVSLIVGDGEVLTFLYAMLVIAGGGLLLWLPFRDQKRDLRARDGFVVVTMFWLVLAGSGAVPLVFGLSPHMSVADAFFESMSGLTTTGATVLSAIDALPPSVLYYRQQLNWLGGMGIVVLAVAVLPMLGIGGMQLYRAETPGPEKDAKLTPRIGETAKALWAIYAALTLACALAFWAGGMSLFDAIGHSFSVLATGGFSPHSASMGYYDRPLLDWIGTVFMYLAAVNFALHFAVWRGRDLSAFRRDPEFRFYTGLVLVATAGVSALLYFGGRYGLADAFRHGAFQVMTFSSNTGLVTTDYYDWSGMLPALLMFISIIGGSAGSTAGGIKAIRFLMLLKQGYRELLRLVHPRGHFDVKLGERVVDERITSAVWGFFATYMAVFGIAMLLLMQDGVDQVTAFSAVVACINNLGIAFGDVASGFADLSTWAKWLLSLVMLMGRLEIFTVLVLLTPAFWKV
ncbi:TrkH family potassium uptake protein [Arhodomonas aquaeolei]|uniref:TrkH family potassium uptake protein n=1 Tax=Arhodomonas aquaeolei TaxID=2369 RepID=UPI00036C99CA|nr:TrkH family potassium uptake protein [Arhodomonas aquaeolei]